MDMLKLAVMLKIPGAKKALKFVTKMSKYSGNLQGLVKRIQTIYVDGEKYNYIIAPDKVLVFDTDISYSDRIKIRRSIERKHGIDIQ